MWGGERRGPTSVYYRVIKNCALNFIFAGGAYHPLFPLEWVIKCISDLLVGAGGQEKTTGTRRCPFALRCGQGREKSVRRVGRVVFDANFIDSFVMLRDPSIEIKIFPNAFHWSPISN